jgi:chlorobactene glucosyltransferase
MTYLALALLLAWSLLVLQMVINLASFRQLPPMDPSGSPEEWPMVSIVIPARNEERDVGATLDAALGQDYPAFEVVIVDDGSTDGTAAEIEARAGNPRLRPMSCPPLPEGWLGKPHALSHGTAVSRGKWLLMMDADVRLAPNAVRLAVGVSEIKGWDHLALLPHFERVGFWEEVLMPSLPFFFFVFSPSFLALWRRTKMAFGGGAFNLVKRTAYDGIGGHHRLANSVVDDVRLAMELKRSGYSSRVALGDSLLRLRMYRGLKEIVGGFTKNSHAVWAGREGLVFLALLWLLALNVLPFGWMGWAMSSSEAALAYPGWMLGLSLALLLVCRTVVQWRLRLPFWPVLFHLLMFLMSFFIVVRSLRMVYGEGLVRWRGREYRRETTTF